MSLRFGAATRLLVLGLLLLVVSPVTAPCSTVDPLDLFGGEAAPASFSGVHKSVQEPHAIACAGPAAGLPVLDTTEAVAARPTPGARVNRQLHVPLRI
jgi:hypothetical protein